MLFIGGLKIMGQNICKITPKVNSSQEFMEIAQDFSNPLDLVRESISNAFDAKAKRIVMDFSVVDLYGEKSLKIEIEDDGTGMDLNGLQSFFDLGNSLRLDDPEAIGEKGHGTKVYFNSNKIEVYSVMHGKKYHAIMDSPKKRLYEHEMPTVDVEICEIDKDEESGTRVIIYGYNNNRREKFTHQQLKDYILWFTKFGSVEKEVGIQKNSDVTLLLKGIDVGEFEKQGIKLRFINTGDVKYKQFGDGFVEKLSILDAIMFNSKDELQAMLGKFELIS